MDDFVLQYISVIEELWTTQKLLLRFDDYEVINDSMFIKNENQPQHTFKSSSNHDWDAQAYFSFKETYEGKWNCYTDVSISFNGQVDNYMRTFSFETPGNYTGGLFQLNQQKLTTILICSVTKLLDLKLAAWTFIHVFLN